jgi:large subunit ribosomal protein L21
MYALVEIQGRQYRVREGAHITVERMAGAGDTVELHNVLLVAHDGETRIGRPHVAGAKVTATLEDHPRGRKLVIYKYRKRKNYRRKQGHRQPLTRLRIDKIDAGS